MSTFKEKKDKIVCFKMDENNCTLQKKLIILGIESLKKNCINLKYTFTLLQKCHF